MKKYAVFALMGIICAGCMWLIFAPSAEDKARQAQTAGFNADIPLPKEEGLIGDKRDACEQEQIKQKQAERMRSLEDFSSLLSSDNPKPTNDLALLTENSPNSSKGGETQRSRAQSPVQNSVNAYRDINRQPGSFYETPKNNPEKEALKKQIEELQAQMDETENRKNAVDEQMALMEKSFQMASKYIPMSAGTNGTPGLLGQMGRNNKRQMPVQMFRAKWLSCLFRSLSNKPFPRFRRK